MTDDWPNVCVLCAPRRDTRLKFGHVCAACTDRLSRDLRSIPELAAMAAAWIEPGSSTGNGSRSVPSSRPPLNVDCLDPALAHVPGHDACLLVLLEEWERMIRDMRHMAHYGPASASRAQGAAGDTTVTLTGVVGFLVAQVEWIVSESGFPVDDFAAEVRACVRVLRRWDADAHEGTGYVVECPHDIEGGTCGRRIRIDGEDAESYFTCPKCGTEWSVDRLMLVWAETSDAAMWLDAEAVTRRYGVDRTTLDRWVRSGRLSKWHGLYDIRPLALAQRGA